MGRKESKQTNNLQKIILAIKEAPQTNNNGVVYISCQITIFAN